MSSYRIINKDEIPEHYQFSANLSDHRIIEDEHGVYRYEKNRLVDWLWSTGSVDLNAMRIAFVHGLFSREEYMEFYRGLGYSLSGFEEVFSDELDEIEREQDNEIGRS